MARNKKQEIKELDFGICHISMMPILAKPMSYGEVISQMLFGETCRIIEKKNKYWHKIKTDVCETIGWVNTYQLAYIDADLHKKLKEKMALSLEVSYPVFNGENSIYITLGSSLPQYDGISCRMPYSRFIYNGQAFQEDVMEITQELFVKLTRRYLFSPEMAGGRSPFGIDKGSFIHQVFRLFNIDITRYIDKQIKFGEVVDFAQLAQIGDIAFFHDINGVIYHAGIIIGHKEIIHVNGYVRIDKFDHNGIYNRDLKKYTHKLRIIKRLSDLNQQFSKTSALSR